MKQIYFLIWLLCCMTTVKAQQKLTGLRVFVNVVSFTEPDGGPALGFEYRIKNNISAALEGQWILYNMNKYNRENYGFRITPDVKYFFPGRHQHYKWFFAAQALYKQVNHYENYIVPHAENGTQVYEELVKYEQQKQVFALGGRFGFQSNFGGKDEKFFFEASVGVGLKWKWKHYTQGPPPETGYKEGDDWFHVDDGGGALPDIPFKVRFGYRF
ncbi:DUF3575 domain-containing protein [Chitinophaga sancti]|uniref:DUF3575 domain-containing protein n=1 Tax=Chitinophaga sancti TaxID=1004 RepID=UPI002A75D65D|nr:DUF3575 domain-containing protein [Chitinophaga sancti]WPQ65638.1 DUF3575 domain-containing protein [Chitinophaga sancti]